MKALIIGGSGGLSGTLASMAKEVYEVWALTRGTRPLEEGIIPLRADRNNSKDFEEAIMNAHTTWDVVFDCICMNERHAKQDLEILSKVTKRLVVISTDSVYDCFHKEAPQNEEGIFVEEQGEPEECTYAGNKRNMEKVFQAYFKRISNGLPNQEEKGMKITLFRPGHIYGNSSFLLGCYPEHSRQKELPELILKECPITLVGGGIHLTQPVFVDDLAGVMLDCVDKMGCFQQIFCVGGPKAVENRRYYEIIGEHLGKKVHFKEVPFLGYLDMHPEFSGHLCHRIYDLSKLEAAGVSLPATSLEEGLRIHLQRMGYQQVSTDY